MTTKTYRAKSEVSFTISIGSRQKRIVFRPIEKGFSVYTTSNEEEQTAIERYYFFGSLFYLEKVETTEVEPVKEKEAPVEKEETATLTAMPDIDNCPDAKHFLSTLGWNGKATSKAMLKSIAEKYGYTFPNLN